MKTLKIEVNSTLKYLQVFNGILELTDKELLVLSRFIDLSDTVNLCSTENKRVVADSLAIKDYNTLNNYVKKLKDKGAIRKTKDGYKLSQILMPQKNINLQILYTNE